MEAHSYCGPGNVVIDSCESCSLNWLDHGELARIAQAPDDRGPDPDYRDPDADQSDDQASAFRHVRRHLWLSGLEVPHLISLSPAPTPPAPSGP